MQIEQTTKPVSQVSLRSDSNEFTQKRETFYDIFQRTLNNKSNSRPPKIELTGVLIPLQDQTNHGCDFKIETDHSEYLLRMSESTKTIARKLAWEEVVAKGYFDIDEGIFEVEKISQSNSSEPLRLSLGPMDLQHEIEHYKRTITKKGKLDVAAEYLAS